MKRPVKILIVEDEVISAMFLEMNLKHEGYELCKPVTTGEEALNSVELQTPHIILMDIRLGGLLDGLETAHLLHAKKKIPIIFLTGYEDDLLQKRVMELSPSALLTKPLEFSSIQKLIASFFPE